MCGSGRWGSDSPSLRTIMVGVWPPKDMMAILCERRRVLDAENGRVDVVFSRIQERRLSGGRHRGAVEALCIGAPKNCCRLFVPRARTMVASGHSRGGTATAKWRPLQPTTKIHAFLKKKREKKKKSHRLIFTEASRIKKNVRLCFAFANLLEPTAYCLLPQPQPLPYIPDTWQAA